MPQSPDPSRHQHDLKRKLFRILLAALVWANSLVTIRPQGLLAAPSKNEISGGWHFLRSANPHGGPEAISVSHTADITRSDIDLAGMMLKCGENGPEVVIVAVTPFPPRARPEVIIGAAGKEWQFAPSIVPPGAQLLLPADATQLAAGPWQMAHELSVKVTSPEQSFAGVIPIDELADAFAELSVNCRPG